jgi:hypothetical protein
MRSALVVAPDCGVKYLSGSVASGKLHATVDRASIMQRELHG